MLAYDKLYIDGEWVEGSSDKVMEDRCPMDGSLLYTYKADGELDLDADQLDEEVNAVFAFDEEGYLICTESTDPAIMGLRFELDPESYGMWAWVF